VCLSLEVGHLGKHTGGVWLSLWEPGGQHMADSVVRLMTRMGCHRVEAVLLSFLDTVICSLMPWTWPLPDVPRHSVSLGKWLGQPGLQSSPSGVQ
jgi:hypothetical protein